MDSASPRRLFHDPAALPMPPVADGAASETQVMVRCQWRRLTAQIHREPACIGPLMVASVPQTQVILQLSGALRLSVNKGRRRRYQTEPGSLYLTAAHRPDYELEWLNLAPEPVRTLQIYLDNDLLAQTAAADVGVDAARLELREGSCLDDPLLRQLGYALARDLTTPEAQHDLYADTVARMISFQLVRQHGTIKPRAPEPGGTLSPRRIRQLHDHVQAHLARPITLDELAVVACLSPYHFCRVFKRTTGQSPNQYVIAQRMARAACLLRQTNLTVEHVARQVGYRSVGHFTLLFRRQMRHSPGE